MRGPAPKAPSARAIGSTKRLAATPTTCRFAPAGLERGPSRLKIVRKPSSWRTGSTWRMAAWCAGANRKQMPASSSARRCWSALAAMLTPRAVSTSDDPDFDEMARVPCLATFSPAPAATKPTAVEMFNVCSPSPPVPQTSMTS